jgi:AcrR family transcriptional regulator
VTDGKDRSEHAIMTPTAPPVDARTDRGRRRREAVVDAAAELFLDRGFHGTSVDDVGAAAGISGPGLYRHFRSKDELLMAVLDRLWQELRPALDEAQTLDPVDGVERLLAAQLDLAFEQPAALVLLVRELRHLPEDYRTRARRNHRRYLDVWADVMIGVRPDLDRDSARSLAAALHGLIDSAALHHKVLPGGLGRAKQRALLERSARAVLAEAVDPAFGRG